jgi:hypothetical protein
MFMHFSNIVEITFITMQFDHFFCEKEDEPVNKYYIENISLRFHNACSVTVI